MLSCEDPEASQCICDGSDDKTIDRLLRRWLARLPHPFDRRDGMAGYGKRSRIKRYHKEGQALRAETTINDTPDFGVGRLLKNLLEFRHIGFAANRRLLEIEQISHDCALGDDGFHHLQQPCQIQGQRAYALRFGDANAQAVLNAVLMFVFVARGFTNKDLRQQFAVLLGKGADDITLERMSYELRRPRLHGLIQRLPKTYRFSAHQ